jgi:excisionase family DNA binding protein
MTQTPLSMESVVVPTKLLLTVNEAARTLSLSRTRVYELVMRKELFSVKVRGSRRIPVKALEEFVEHLTQMQKAGRR